MLTWGRILLVLLLAVGGAVRGFEVSQSEWDAMKKEIADLRSERKSASTPVRKDVVVDKALENKGYGPDAPVKTRTGKLVIGGVVQCWYYGFADDHRGLFDDPAINSVSDSNAYANNGFRIRRQELTFKLDIHENVAAFVKIDTAKEGWPGAPVLTDNQINTGFAFKAINNVAANYQSIVGATKPFGFGSTTILNKVQTGAPSTFQSQLLENAYIVYHDVIPHTEFQIGEFVPKTGELGSRDGSQQDFIERDFCGLLDNHYNPGAAIHGMWWDDRFQYWVSGMQSNGDFFGSNSTNQANRVAMNSDVDLGLRGMLRPVYANETWGNLEIGGGTLFGKHGSSNNLTTLGNPGTPDNGLIEVRTSAYNDFAWLWYRPGYVVSGLWMRWEWKQMKDRMEPGSVMDPYGNGTDTKSNFVQQIGKPILTHGFYTALGYNMANSYFSESLPSWSRAFEFAGRYAEYTNVLVADENNPTHTDLYRTRVITAGINYYIRGHDAKIQLNYNWMFNPSVDNNPDLSFHNTRDDSFAMNFQVGF
jgi:hypothetical protein